MKWKALLAAFFAALLVTGCVPRGEAPASQAEAEVTSAEESPAAASPAGGILPGVSAENYPRVDGSTANMPLLAKLYSEICGVPIKEAETLVAVSGGTGAVWRNMMYQGADVLLVYEAPEVVKAEMEAEGLELEITPVGRDGLVFLVNSANPVDSLTREQLMDIYTGKITDWGEVDGDSGAIAAFKRNEESGSQTLFMKLLMGETEPMEPPTELKVMGMGALIDGVAAYDGSGGAIGYSVFYYANLMYESPDLKLLAVDGVEPATESIRSGEYPLVNDFYVVIRKDEPEGSPARLLRDFMLTEAGAEILTEAGYVAIQ